MNSNKERPRRSYLLGLFYTYLTLPYSSIKVYVLRISSLFIKRHAFAFIVTEITKKTCPTIMNKHSSATFFFSFLLPTAYVVPLLTSHFLSGKGFDTTIVYGVFL